MDVCLPSGEYRSYVENSIVDASIFLVETAAFCEVVVIRGKTMFVVRSRFCGADDNHWSIPSRCRPGEPGWGVAEAILTHVVCQVLKSKRWMPWQLEPKKDVAICDNPRGADKRASIRGCPNGETPAGPAMGPVDSRLNI